MKNKYFLKNLMVDIIINGLLIMKLFNFGGIYVERCLKIIPLFLIIYILLAILVVGALCSYDELTEKTQISANELVNFCLKYRDEQTKFEKIYHQITDVLLFTLFALNGFLGCFTLAAVLKFLMKMFYNVCSDIQEKYINPEEN